DAEDRLPLRELPRERREAARVAEGLEVEEDDVRALVLEPVLEEVVARDVRLVADRREHAEAEAEALRVLEERRAERAGLRHERDAALDRLGAREGRVHAVGGLGVDDAHAVRADHAHAGAADALEQRALPSDALAADLAEAGGDHDEAAH